MMSAKKKNCFRGGASYILMDFEDFWNKSLLNHGQKDKNEASIQFVCKSEGLLTS